MSVQTNPKSKKRKAPYVSEEVYNLMMSITSCNRPHAEDKHGTMVRYITLQEVQEKITNAYLQGK